MKTIEGQTLKSLLKARGTPANINGTLHGETFADVVCKRNLVSISEGRRAKMLANFRKDSAVLFVDSVAPIYFFEKR
jgi:hypothetical protein